MGYLRSAQCTAITCGSKDAGCGYLLSYHSPYLLVGEFFSASAAPKVKNPLRVFVRNIRSGGAANFAAPELHPNDHYWSLRIPRAIVAPRGTSHLPDSVED